jgi:hypothetical protein
MTLFGVPQIIADPAADADGSPLLYSAELLGLYPVTVVHSLRLWAQTDPDRLLVAERGPDGAWRGYAKSYYCGAWDSREAAWSRPHCSQLP